jgi:hypothetical protein
MAYHHGAGAEDFKAKQHQSNLFLDGKKSANPTILLWTELKKF